MHIISTSYGNDSKALIQWAFEQGLNDVICAYIDTGWSSKEWSIEIDTGESLAARCGYKTVRIKPDVQFTELMQMKKGFPNQKFQWCSGLLKGIPFLNWADEIDKDCKYTVMVGKRREESKERANTPEYIENSEYHGGRLLWHPLYSHSDEDRNDLLDRAGVKVIPHRSHECQPCVNANRADLSIMADSDIEKVKNLELLVGKNMFRPARHNGAKGIVNVVEWAKRGKYIEGHYDLFDSGCGSPFGCGL